MLKVLIIPEKSESFVLPSIKVASETLGIGDHRLRYAIATGHALKMDGKKFYVDYELDLSDIDSTEKPSKRANVYRYELTDQLSGAKSRFTSYNKMAKFIHRNSAYAMKRLSDGQVLESPTGNFYTLRLL